MGDGHTPQWSAETKMQSSRRSLILGLSALALTPALAMAQDDDSTPESNDKQHMQEPAGSNTPVASPEAEDDAPLIDIIKLGAWGTASREFQQTGSFPGYAIVMEASIAAFDDADAASGAMPEIRATLMENAPYNEMDEEKLTLLGDDQIFLFGTMTSQGYEFVINFLLVQRGPYIALAGGVGIEDLDMRNDVIDVVDLVLGNAEEDEPVTSEELMAVMPEPDDLPQLPTAKRFYEISEERSRGGDKAD